MGAIYGRRIHDPTLELSRPLWVHGAKIARYFLLLDWPDVSVQLETSWVGPLYGMDAMGAGPRPTLTVLSLALGLILGKGQCRAIGHYFSLFQVREDLI